MFLGHYHEIVQECHTNKNRVFVTLDSSDPDNQPGEGASPDQQVEETPFSNVSGETTPLKESPSSSKQAGIVFISVLM